MKMKDNMKKLLILVFLVSLFTSCWTKTEYGKLAHECDSLSMKRAELLVQNKNLVKEINLLNKERNLLQENKMQDYHFYVVLKVRHYGYKYGGGYSIIALPVEKRAFDELTIGKEINYIYKANNNGDINVEVWEKLIGKNYKDCYSQVAKIIRDSKRKK